MPCPVQSVFWAIQCGLNELIIHCQSRCHLSEGCSSELVLTSTLWFARIKSAVKFFLVGPLRYSILSEEES